MMYKHQTFGWSLVGLADTRIGRAAKKAPMPLPGPARMYGGHTKIFPAFS